MTRVESSFWREAMRLIDPGFPRRLVQPGFPGEDDCDDYLDIMANGMQSQSHIDAESDSHYEQVKIRNAARRDDRARSGLVLLHCSPATRNAAAVSQFAGRRETTLSRLSS